MNEVPMLDGPTTLVKAFDRWVKTEKRVALDSVECTIFVRRVLDEHLVQYTPGAPHLTIDGDEYMTSEFFEQLFNHLSQQPGVVVGQVNPKGGHQEQKKTSQNGRFSASISYQVMFRFLKANAGQFFTVVEIGEALNFFDGIDPIIHKQAWRTKTRAIRGYLRQMFRLNPAGRIKKPGTYSLYGFQK